jgi:CRP-like cAMP-binding protein
VPGSFYERAVYAVTAITDLRMQVCALDDFVQLAYRRPQYGLALAWIAVQEATTYVEHIIDVGRRTPSERLAHFLLELHVRLRAVGLAETTRFNLPFSQKVIADVLGLSVPHVNRMQRLTCGQNESPTQSASLNFSMQTRCRRWRNISRWN